MTTLLDFRAWARADLRDTDPAAYLWPDATLDRHILRAVQEYQQACPRQGTRDLAAEAGAVDYPLAGPNAIPDLLWIEAVEYPVGSRPPSWAPFSTWGDNLHLRIAEPPAEGETIRLYLALAHVVDAAGSTVPVADEHTVALGAAGFAALDQSVFTINRLNTSTWTPRRYQEWAAGQLDLFRARLRARAAATVARGGSVITVRGYEL